MWYACVVHWLFMHIQQHTYIEWVEPLSMRKATQHEKNHSAWEKTTQHEKKTLSMRKKHSAWEKKHSAWENHSAWEKNTQHEKKPLSMRKNNSVWERATQYGFSPDREFSGWPLTEFWRHILSGCQVCDWGIRCHLCSTYKGLWGLVVVQLP